MYSLRLVPMILLLSFCVSCVQLNYPADPPLDSSPGQNGDESEMDAPLSWSELTRLAREDRRRDQLTKANERLSKAAILVEGRAPTHVSRRTVFGLRARLAIDLAESGDLEAADSLADLLLSEAESTPEIGGPALVSLARSVAERRQAAAAENGEEASQLSLLRTALTTAQAGRVSRDRMELASKVAKIAFREDEIGFARTAIDQCLADADLIIPANKDRLAALRLEHARIALAGDDLEAAQSSATAANQMLDEIDADASRRGVAEVVLAEILAAKGEFEMALVIASGAQARIGGDEPISDPASRLILSTLARIEKSAGDVDSARVHFEQALALPGVPETADEDLVRDITREIGELEARELP